MSDQLGIACIGRFTSVYGGSGLYMVVTVAEKGVCQSGSEHSMLEVKGEAVRRLGFLGSLVKVKVKVLGLRVNGLGLRYF